MKEKINELLQSRKFWLATLTMILGVASYYYDVPEQVRNYILAWGISITGIGVADSIATKIGGGAKPPATRDLIEELSNLRD